MMVTMRGGVHKLSDDYQLRLMIFWFVKLPFESEVRLTSMPYRVDILVALLNDQQPRFSAPSELFPPVISSATVPITIVEIASSLVETHDWTASCQCAIDTLAKLANVSLLIQADLVSKGKDLWKDELSLGFHINPIAHHLLESLPTGCFQISTHAILEALRLGMIVWIIWTKQMSQAYPAQTTPYVARLLDLLSDRSKWQFMVDRPSIVTLYFWLFMICATTCSATRQNPAALGSLAFIINRMNVPSSQEAMARLRSMPWVNGFESQWALLMEDTVTSLLMVETNVRIEKGTLI